MKVTLNRLTMLAFAACCLLTANLAKASAISEIDHDAFMAIANESMIVDVRTPEEYAEGHVPGAVNIPLSTIEDNIDLFGAKDTSIIMYCRSGVRAGKALNILSEAGYNNLNHLEGDMSGWQEANREIVVPEK